MIPEHLTKSTRSAKTAMFAALVLIGAIAVYNRTVAPHRNYLMAAQQYESAVDHLDRKNQTISQDLTVKRKELEELQGKFRQIHLELFDPAEAGRFFSHIQTKSQEAGCIVSQLTFSTASLASGEKRSKSNHYITKEQAMLSVVGGFSNILALMNKLQDSPKKVCIDSVTINADDQGTVHLECKMAVTIYVIHRKEEDQHD